MSSEATQDRLKRLLAQKGIRLADPASEPGPRPPGEPAPLSFAQERLWFLHRLDPESRAYHLGQAFDLRGPVNVPALARALEQLVLRHEALRTGFEIDPSGSPRLVTVPSASNLLHIEDFTGVSLEKLSSEALAAEQRFFSEPFDLARPPLFRALLLNFSLGVRRLAICVHHLAFDGWSIGILARELAALYSGVSVLPPPALSYADYAAWQRRRASEPAWQETLGWWERRLKGLPNLELPSDRPRPARASGRGAVRRFAIPAALDARLRELALRENTTLFAVLLAGYQALLARHSAQDDFGVGVTVAGRTHRSLEDVVGLFVNTVVFRADLSGNPAFSELVRRVRDESLEVLPRQETPFEQIVDRLQTERDLSRNPLFQAGLFLQNTPAADFRLGSAALQPTVSESASAKFDLLLLLEELPDGGLVAALEYSTDLFDRGTIGRMAARYLALLASAAEHPGRPLGELSWLAPEDRSEIALWSAGPPADFSGGLWIHEFPDRQPADALALTDGARRYTYAQFRGEAERLARALRGLGAGPETLVGVCLERSAELVIALHAVLRAGAAYVPLDPNYPAERLAWMAGDAGAPIVVTTRALLDRLPGCQAKMLFIEEPWPDGPVHGARPLGASAAYTIYTSGSTGRPKGAVNTHEGIRNLLLWIQGAFPLKPGDVFLQKTPCSFDVSVREFFWPFLAGAQLAIAEPGAHRDPARVIALVRERGVTQINFVPSVFRAFLDTPGVEACRTLRRIYCTGEELSRDLADKAKALLGCEVVNLYGPTEAAVEFTWHACGADPGPVPIGRPMANLEVQILDRFLAPVPRGVPGEVHLGGIHLARGYRRRPDLTADRWIPHPSNPGQRLYRTGDLGRWLPNGEILYLGRTDFQVKLRGQRIELGEIEAVILEHPAVREAAVVVRDHRLVAYAVPRSGPLPTDELRAFLAQRLPEYMVPPSWVELPALPLNTAGKTDRKALPAPAAAPASHAPPQGEREELLAASWREVLRVPSVGRDDGYFDLGGDSILSIRLQAKVRAQGWDFALADLFQHQTLQALARVLKPHAARAEAAAPFSLLAPADRDKLPPGLDDAYPLTALQSGMVLHAELHPDSPTYREVFSYEVRAPWSEEALRASLEALAQRHAILRTAFALRGFSEPLQFVHAQAPAPFGASDLRSRPRAEQDAELARFFAAELARGFEWSEPPLWRAHAHRRTDATWQFTLCAHHAILDGWSASSLLAELFDGYLARASGHAPAPRPAPPPFARYVALERASMAGAADRAFWTDALSESNLGRLPRRPDRPSERRQASAWRSWSRADLEALQALASQAGVSLKHVLLAAHLKAVQAYAAQADVTTGVITGGRPEGEGAEETLGLFLNTMPLRLRLRPGSWLDLLRSVFRAEEAAWPHRRHPLAEIQKLHGRRELFDTTFNYVHYHGLDALRARSDVAVLGAQAFDQNSFNYFAQYTLDSVKGELALELRYDASEFTPGQAQAFADANRAALAAMVAAPETNHAATSLLALEEWHQVVRSFNADPLPTGGPRLLHEAFFARALRSPNAVALIDGTRRLTYGELAARARAWAARLAASPTVAGVADPGRERLIGICLERSADLVTAILAVLESGAAYVPLDPAYPAERLRFFCNDARISALISRPELAAKLGPLSCPLIDPKELSAAAGAGWSALSPTRSNPVHPSQLAYLIYTSGSTGKPKATAIEHHSACALLAWARAAYPDSELAGTLFSTSVCFDLSIFELFATFNAGGKVIIADHVLALPELPARGEVTLINTVPSAAAELVRQKAIPPGVRVVNLAGEPLSAALADQLFATGTVEKVYDLYGPSEDTTYSTWGLRAPGGPETIGRVLPGSQLFLLDEFLQPVPLGAVGEIFLGGAGLARGYLNRPDLTAERFVPDPFSALAGSRLYRTGDLARLREDGRLEFLGRADHQVKIRGFRIELGEIQTALERHPDIAEAAVLARDDANGRKQLVAYVVGLPSTADLRAWLSSRLPDAFIPSAFVVLPKLPRTPNGKLDRAALIAADPRSGSPRRSSAKPSEDGPSLTPTELILAQIWSDILRVSSITGTSDYFALGGDSILAFQVSSRAREAGLAVTPRMLFEHPKLSALAAAAEGAHSPPHAHSVGISLASGPLTPIQRWFFAQDFAEPYHWNQSVLLKPRAPLDASALERALAYVGERHPALRSRFERGADGHWRSALREEPAFAFRTIPLPAPEALTALCAAEQASFDLDSGHLASALWFQGNASDPGRLFLVIHHLAVDGVSWRILLDELAAAYDAFRSGREPALPAPSLAPAAWAGWLETLTHGGGFASERAHWTALAAPPEPPLPRDLSGGDNTVGSADQFSVSLTPAETEALLRQAPAALGASLDDLLLAALALALREWTGRESHLIHREGHGREPLDSGLDLGRSVGWFTTLYPVRLDLGGAGEAVRALGAIRSQLAATPRRGLGYGAGRYLSDPPAWPEASAELCFNYLGQFDGVAGPDAPFAPADEPTGPSLSPKGRRTHLLGVNGLIIAGTLRFEWQYPSKLLHRSTVQRLAERHLAHLRALLAASGSGSRDAELDRAIAEIEL